jgi:hypothetical protein
VAKAGGPRRHPNHLAISSPAGTYGTGPFLPPSFFTGATRAYKWRGISGRTRAPCGWLIARTRARHPPRHAPLPRARPLQPPTTATVPTTTSASTTRSTSRLDRSCMRPSPVPTTRLQISRTDAVEQSACTLHANSCWLAGQLLAAGDRRRARGCGCAPRETETRRRWANYFRFRLSYHGWNKSDAARRRTYRHAAGSAEAIHTAVGAHETIEWLAAKLRAEQLALPRSSSTDICTGRLWRWLARHVQLSLELFLLAVLLR